MFSSLELSRAYALVGDAIFTMDPAQPRVRAVGVVDGRSLPWAAWRMWKLRCLPIASH